MAKRSTPRAKSIRIPHCRPGRWPKGISGSRFASLIRTDAPDGCGVALLGMPDDLGVRLNGGRPGAAKGPSAFREALAKYGVARPQGWEWLGVYDAGDVEPATGSTAAALAKTHARVTEAARALRERGMLPVAVGGGHDLTFAFVRGVMAGDSGELGQWAGEYFDAHLDVRETPGSGMPFRKLIEDCGVKSLTLHGFNPMANSGEHAEWFLSHGGRLAGALSERVHADTQDRVFVSVDMDCFDGAFAPGVSAVNPAGLSPREVAQRVERLGKDRRVACLDLMELNPRFDADGRTARLAAHLFLTFLRGVSAR